MTSDDRAALTDSPWFWVLVFSLMALGALAAISGKYGRRQSGLERKYQAGERIAAQAGSGATANGDATRREFATPDETLVPLWPLAVILVAVATFAVVMLLRGRGRPGSLVDEIPPP